MTQLNFGDDNGPRPQLPKEFDRTVAKGKNYLINWKNENARYAFVEGYDEEELHLGSRTQDPPRDWSFMRAGTVPFGRGNSTSPTIKRKASISTGSPAEHVKERWLADWKRRKAAEKRQKDERRRGVFEEHYKGAERRKVDENRMHEDEQRRQEEQNQHRSRIIDSGFTDSQEGAPACRNCERHRSMRPSEPRLRYDEHEVQLNLVNFHGASNRIASPETDSEMEILPSIESDEGIFYDALIDKNSDIFEERDDFVDETLAETENESFPGMEAESIAEADNESFAASLTECVMEAERRRTPEIGPKTTNDHTFEAGQQLSIERRKSLTPTQEATGNWEVMVEPIVSKDQSATTASSTVSTLVAGSRTTMATSVTEGTTDTEQMAISENSIQMRTTPTSTSKHRGTQNSHSEPSNVTTIPLREHTLTGKVYKELDRIELLGHAETNKLRYAAQQTPKFWEKRLSLAHDLKSFLHPDLEAFSRMTGDRLVRTMMDFLCEHHPNEPAKFFWYLLHVANKDLPEEVTLFGADAHRRQVSDTFERLEISELFEEVKIILADDGWRWGRRIWGRNEVQYHRDPPLIWPDSSYDERPASEQSKNIVPEDGSKKHAKRGTRRTARSTQADVFLHRDNREEIELNVGNWVLSRIFATAMAAEEAHTQ